MTLREFLKVLADAEMSDPVVIYDAEYSIVFDIEGVFIEDGNVYLDINSKKEKTRQPASKDESINTTP